MIAWLAAWTLRWTAAGILCVFFGLVAVVLWLTFYWMDNNDRD